MPADVERLVRRQVVWKYRHGVSRQGGRSLMTRIATLPGNRLKVSASLSGAALPGRPPNNRRATGRPQPRASTVDVSVPCPTSLRSRRPNHSTSRLLFTERRRGSILGSAPVSRLVHAKLTGHNRETLRHISHIVYNLGPCDEPQPPRHLPRRRRGRGRDRAGPSGSLPLDVLRPARYSGCLRVRTTASGPLGSAAFEDVALSSEPAVVLCLRSVASPAEHDPVATVVLVFFPLWGSHLPSC